MEFSEDHNTGREPDQGLQLAMKGDREELGRLFASNMPQLYRVALRILGTPQDAEEALQDGFLGAFRHLGEFECRSRFSTWLTRIVINAALMRLRKSRRETLTSIDQTLDGEETAWADRISDPGPNPEEIYVWKERLQIVQQNFRNLPEGYRSVLWLRDVEGMSTQEAAEILGVKTATVKSQLHRARLRLGKKGRTASVEQRTVQTTRCESGIPRDPFTAGWMAAVAHPAA